MKLKLEGKNVVVTGGAQGIGQAIAESFLAEGATVIITDIQPRPEGLPSEVHYFQVDLTKEENILSLAENCLTAVGNVDVLVNNAGITEPAALEELTSESWQKVMKVNTDAVYMVSRAFYPQLKESQGNVVTLASFAGKRGTLFGNNASYSTSKAAVIGFTRAMSVEAAKFGVRFNAVAPGAVSTDLIKALTPEQQRKVTDLVPLERYAEVNEVADLVTFMASERCTYMTGEVVNLNGGLYLD
ncbi:SDR family NAD(P)-dependent oxidoreductase [Photobacterium satsumensis]|uniref:SDR family NAD(P)-dependent oxidoreductase n=1 Tax=Photobacterium satsumensis TaxID=2910239 RepID=UPI003D12FCBC